MSVYEKLVHAAGLFKPCKSCGAEYETPATPRPVTCAVCGHRADVDGRLCDCRRCWSEVLRVLPNLGWDERKER